MAKSRKVKDLNEAQIEVGSGEPVVIKPMNLHGDKNTEEALESQDKVQVLIEKRKGEYPLMEFTVNGVRYTVKRGVPSLVPKQIAQMWTERLQSEGRMVETSQAMVANLKNM